MSPLSTYLWKEWREQRATLAVLAAALLVGIAAVVAALPATLADDPLVFQGAVAIALLATIMSTGCDLLARERSGAALGFLERLPAGLAVAFRAKLVFFALALASAAIYGALLATAAALLRSGKLAQGLLEGPAPWVLALLLGISLWVFALSAWMPASALTFPGTVLLLAALAWPGVLALSGEPLYQPTPLQVLAFALLSLAGAPVSAWAAFVAGSRQGRSRRTAALAGLTAAALFFAPTWAWAAGRFATLVNAPFEILRGWVSPNGHHAFLTLTRRPPHGVTEVRERAWNRSTALLVDLKRREWRFPGEVDGSAFIGEFGRQHWQLLLDERRLPPLTLVEVEPGGAIDRLGEQAFDPDTAHLLHPQEARGWKPQGPSPLDFGLDVTPRWFVLKWAGLGHALTYLHEEPQEQKRWITLYRDLAGDLVVGRDAILPRDAQGNSNGEVRIRPGRWLVRNDKDWYLADPVTYERSELDGFGAGDSIGPSLEDGRVLMTSGGEAFLLDPDSGIRTRLQTLGRQGFAVHRIDRFNTPSGALYPLPVDGPTVIGLSAPKECTLGLLDVRTGTLRVQSENTSMLSAILWTSESKAIVQEDHERLVLYDVASDQRDVLFSVEEID